MRTTHTIPVTLLSPAAVALAVLAVGCFSSSSSAPPDAPKFDGGGDAAVASDDGGSGDATTPDASDAGSPDSAACQAYYHVFFEAGAQCASCGSTNAGPCTLETNDAGCSVTACEQQCGYGNCPCLESCVGACQATVEAYWACVDSKCPGC